MAEQRQSYKLVKADTVVTAGGSRLVLSGLTLVGTVIALALATPLMLICSPVLLPAVITVFLLITGFLASGGFGVAAISLLASMYKFATISHPPGDDKLHQARMQVANKARDVKEHLGSTAGQAS